jgi:predicted dehydrogenase
VTIRRNRPLRGAIVGFGNVAVEGHLPAWQSDRHYEILAVCDADEARLALAAEHLPAARRYATLAELLDQERLDFVDIATPPATHAALVCEALDRKLHVLCEKPLAISIEECNQIRGAASAARAVVFTVHNWKYAPLFRTAKRALRRGEIGRVTHLTLETLRSEPPGGAAGGTWRLDPALAGGGVVVDHGWHAFYLAQYLLDAEPLAVSARTTQRKFTTTAAEDTASCTLEFPGTTVEIFLTWAADERRNRGRVVGEHGTIELADRKLTVAVTGRAPVETAFAQPLSTGSYHPDWFTTMVGDFRDELLDATLRGVNFREAETACRLVALSYQSSAAGGTRLELRGASAPAGA